MAWIKYKLSEEDSKKILECLEKENISNINFCTTESKYYNVTDTVENIVPGIRQIFYWEPPQVSTTESVKIWFDKNTKYLIPGDRSVFLQKDDQFIESTGVDNLNAIDSILRFCKVEPTFNIKTSIISFNIINATYFISRLENNNQFYLEGDEMDGIPHIQEFANKYNVSEIEDRSFFTIVKQIENP